MKKLINKTAVGMILLIISSNSFAFSECVRDVKKIWSNFGSSTTVYVCFETGSCIYKDESNITEGQMARLMSMALTAKTTGKRLQVRYPEDDLVCPPSGASARNDFIGFWLVD